MKLSRLALVFALCAASVAARAQGTPTTHVQDSSLLKPPAGYKVAIVEWEDMECPQCARAFPLLKDAAAKYKMPWIQYDFPLPMHTWSRSAAIDARWFDQKSKDLGNEFRGKIFEAQMYIHNDDSVRGIAQNFAKAHGMDLPFVVDPQGKLNAMVEADKTAGTKMGLNHTPTIFIVTNGDKAPQYTEILDLTKIVETIDGVIRQTGGVADAKSAAKTATRHTAK